MLHLMCMQTFITCHTCSENQEWERPWKKLSAKFGPTCRSNDWMDLNPANYRWSLRDCRLGQSGSPRSRKRTDSLVKVEYSHASSRCGSVPQWLERSTRIRKTLGSIPGGAAQCFFVWSGCQFFYLCRSWKRREFEAVFYLAKATFAVKFLFFGSGFGSLPPF